MIPGDTANSSTLPHKCPRANGSAMEQTPAKANDNNTATRQNQAAGDWEKRLSENITWIRNEIVELKKQDKSLTRQFIELRSVIHHLRRYGFINRLPNTLLEDGIPVKERVVTFAEETPTNTPPITHGTLPLSPRKKDSPNWYQTLPSKKHLNHQRGPGEPRASPPKHFFTDDSGPESGSGDSIEDFHGDISEISPFGYRIRAVSVLTPTCVNSPGGPRGSFLRSRNMSFTSGATEDEYDC